MSDLPSVAVVVVCKSEPPDRVQRALASVVAQDYGGPIDVVVAAPPGEVDAPGVTVVANPSPTGNRSAGLNAAVAASKGEIIVRLDARTVFPGDYIRRCVARMQSDTSIGVVGGVQQAQASLSSSSTAEGVCRALRNPWATGGAAYRRVGAGGEVDTVYLGVFRRHELVRLGGWDERLVTNQDFDLAHRYRAAGLKVWLEEGLVVGYEPRTAMRELWGQYVAFGRGKVRYWRLTGDRPSRRQVAALLAVPALLAGTLVRSEALAIAAVVLVVVDHLADPSERSVRVRRVALLAYLPIVGGWLTGIVLEAVARRRSS